MLDGFVDGAHERGALDGLAGVGSAGAERRALGDCPSCTVVGDVGDELFDGLVDMGVARRVQLGGEREEPRLASCGGGGERWAGRAGELVRRRAELIAS
jgi:hypothetical protein